MKLREIRDELKDLRGSDAAKVTDELAKLKKEQFNLRFQKATGQLEKTSRVRDVRRAVARAQTVLAQKNAQKN